MAPQTAVRRSQAALTQMPLCGNKLKSTTSPRVTLGSWKKSWFVACKNLPLCLNRYGRISQAVRPLGVPYSQGRWPCIFFATCDRPPANCVYYMHYIRIGYGQISQRAAQGSLYRGAGRQRRSERLKAGPYAQGRWPCIFLRPATGRLRISLLSFVSPLDAVDGGTADAEFLGDFGAAFSFAAHFLDSFIGQIFQAAVFILH